MATDRKYYFERQRTEDPVLESIQDNLENLVTQINRRVSISVALPAAGTIKVKHPLGHVPVSWKVVRVRKGLFQAYESASDAKTITFTSGSACKADIQLE